MLKPSMQELMKRVGNRYLLVNLAAQRARDIAEAAEIKKEQLPDKAVKLALDEIAAGEIVYRPGPRSDILASQNHPISASIVGVGGSVSFNDDDAQDGDDDLDDMESEEDDDLDDLDDEDENDDEDDGILHSLDELESAELSDGDIPEEDR